MRRFWNWDKLGDAEKSFAIVLALALLMLAALVIVNAGGGGIESEVQDKIANEGVYEDVTVNKCSKTGLVLQGSDVWSCDVDIEGYDTERCYYRAGGELELTTQCREQ